MLHLRAHYIIRYPTGASPRRKETPRPPACQAAFIGMSAIYLSVIVYLTLIVLLGALRRKLCTNSTNPKANHNQLHPGYRCKSYNKKLKPVFYFRFLDFHVDQNVNNSGNSMNGEE